MKTTIEQPAEPGLYWYRHRDATMWQPVTVRRQWVSGQEHELCYESGAFQGRLINFAPGEWSQRIPLPHEGDDAKEEVARLTKERDELSNACREAQNRATSAEEPTSIKAEIRKTIRTAPQFKVHSVDITGGVESAEYVRSMRGDLSARQETADELQEEVDRLTKERDALKAEVARYESIRSQQYENRDDDERTIARLTDELAALSSTCCDVQHCTASAEDAINSIIARVRAALLPSGTSLTTLATPSNMPGRANPS